ncbi:extracellular solute-binding protein [Vibrio sp. HN007]|uniref:sugar ABC transporter substrate-binding protein n=1 Tax=Vibrio iocasae TaxID=3098914 RepID=UPI0035D47687
MKHLLLFLLICSGPIYAQQELTLWHDKYQAKLLYEKVGQIFELKTGAKLSVHYMPTGVLKLTALKNSNSEAAPDILVAPSDFIGNRNSLNLSEVPESFNQESLPLAKASVTDNGKQFGIPLLFGNHLLLYYNKQLISEPANNWEEMSAQKSEIESKGASLISWKTDEMYWVIPFLTAFGGSPINGSDISFDNKQIQMGLELYKKQAEMAGISSGCDYSCVHQDFIDNKYAYSINGDWAYKTYREELGTDLGVALMPEVEGKPMHSFYSSIALLFPGNSLNGDKQKLLNEFIQHIQSVEHQVLLHHYVGMMPAKTEAYKLVANELENDPNFQTMLEQLNQSILMPPNQAMAAAWLGMQKGVTIFMRGKTESDKAVQLMQKHTLKELNRQK